MQPEKVLPLCVMPGQGSGGGSMEPFVCKSPTKHSGGLHSPCWLVLDSGHVVETGCSTSAGPNVIAEGGGIGRGWTLVVFEAG